MTPSPAYTVSVTRFAPVNCLERKSVRSRSGWRWRRSTTMNPTNATTPTTSAMTTPGLSPSPSSMRPEVVEASATVISAAPRRSGRGASIPSEVSGRCRIATTTVAAAIGMLMKNTGRHEKLSTSQPPTKGPRAPAAAPKPDHAPTARARSSGWNDAEIMARLLGTRSAPAAPCRARAAISTWMVGASPHSSDAPLKPISPSTNTRRRP